MNKKAATGWALIIGLSVYYFLSAIPLIGFVFWTVAGLAGLGAILLSKRQIYSELRRKNLI